MPFITIKVNVPVSSEQENEIKSYLGRAIESVPGKTEQYLMIIIEDNCRIWLRGINTAPAAYVEASIYGNNNHKGFDKFTYEATIALNKVLDIPAENIYLKYDDISVWGVNGFTIAR